MKDIKKKMKRDGKTWKNTDKQMTIMKDIKKKMKKWKNMEKHRKTNEHNEEH